MIDVLLPSNAATLVPLLTLIGAATGILLLDVWGAPWQFSAWVSLASLVVATALTLIVVASGQGGAIQGMLGGDGAAALFTLYFCGVGGTTALISLGSAGIRDGGGYALLLFAISGALVVAQSTHMLPLAIGLTILHVALSALIGPGAAWRFLIAQGAGLASLLLGISLLYGATGSLRMDTVSENLSRQANVGVTNPLAALGLGLTIGGLALPLGVMPFHTWLPAACRKARPLGRLLLSMALPGAAIAALSRLGGAWLGRSRDLVATMGVLSILLGHWTALRSPAIEDALTGIWIAQSGILVLTALAGSTIGWTASLYILVSNGLNLACLWAVIVDVSREEEHPLSLAGIAGLGRDRPWIAGAVTFCLLN
jgi:NADH-quinone oxidoreductase subunit N